MMDLLAFSEACSAGGGWSTNAPGRCIGNPTAFAYSPFITVAEGDQRATTVVSSSRAEKSEGLRV